MIWSVHKIGRYSTEPKENIHVSRCFLKFSREIAKQTKEIMLKAIDKMVLLERTEKTEAIGDLGNINKNVQKTKKQELYKKIITGQATQRDTTTRNKGNLYSILKKKTKKYC